MKLRDKILYMSFGAGLVVLGMVLNSLISYDDRKHNFFGGLPCFLPLLLHTHQGT